MPALKELTFQSKQLYQQPFIEIELQVTFTSPSGHPSTIDAFWDGERDGFPIWRARFSPNEAGTWYWQSNCRPMTDLRLHQQQGHFEVCLATPAMNETDNISSDTERGKITSGYGCHPLRLSKDQTRLIGPDGEPFFWLADTAWNGPLKSNDDDWNRYLSARKKQGFNVIQAIATQWHGGTQSLPDLIYLGDKNICVNTPYLRAMDEKILAIHQQGLVAAPVLLWALQEIDPGCALPEDDAIRLSRYLIARWGAWNVVWFLGGDGHFEDTARWKRIARAVLDRRDQNDPMKRLATLHPCACKWIADDFGDENWLDFIGYQSSHGDDEGSLRWHTSGPPAKEWHKKPLRPVINLEPNYEAISCSPGMPPRSPQQVRRAAYWSLLISPTAGVSYGHHVIWPWNDRHGDIEGHAFCGKADAWHTGLDAEGAWNMKTLLDIFTSGPWADLTPLSELLSHQPGEKNPKQFAAAAQTPNRAWSLIYLPEGGEIELNKDQLPPHWQAYLLDPITGDRQPLSAKDHCFSLPSDHDYLLEIKHLHEPERSNPTGLNLLSKIKRLSSHFRNPNAK